MKWILYLKALTFFLSCNFGFNATNYKDITIKYPVGDEIEYPEVRPEIKNMENNSNR